MEIGTSLLTQYDASVDPETAWRHVSELASVVDDGGFNSLWIGEHHVTPEYLYFENGATLAALASETSNVTLGAGALLLPLHNPIQVAEIGATIDVISGGRFQLACGLGYREEEFRAFGVDRESRVRRLETGVDLIRRLWTESGVTVESEFWTVEDVTINPKPVQDPHPPLLVAGYVDAAAKRAANLADSWFYGNVQDKRELERQFGVYEEAVSSAGREEGCYAPPVLREGFVHRDEERAFELVEPYLTAKLESYAEWGLGNVDLDADFREHCRDRFLVGSPETVLAELEEYGDLGVEEVVLRVQYPGMDPAVARTSLETIADEVVPHL